MRPEHPLASQNGQTVEHPQPHRLAGHGHAQGMDHVADLDPFGLDELPQTGLRIGSVKRIK